MIIDEVGVLAAVQDGEVGSDDPARDDLDGFDLLTGLAPEGVLSAMGLPAEVVLQAVRAAAQQPAAAVGAAAFLGRIAEFAGPERGHRHRDRGEQEPV